ncbi:MAG: hypothetical protein ACLSWI_09580 [Candidatus Gastranaerophilaceae bacterium]
MKRLFLLILGMFTLIQTADAGIITNFSPFNNYYRQPYYGNNRYGYNNNYYPNRRVRRYYNNANSNYYNNNFRRPSRYYNNGYNNYGYGYRRPVVINRVNRINSNKLDAFEGYVSYKETNNANFTYPKITQIEKTILGRTYEHQDLDLRLNRLEKSVFNKTYPSMSYDERVNNIIVNYNTNSTSDINLNNLSRIESKVLGRNYAFDTPKSRVERIEEKMFGAVQSGNISERFETIKHASKNYKSYSAYANQDPYGTCYQNSNRGYAAPPVVSTTGIRSMLGSMGNYLWGGYPTGYTPQMDPAYMDYFEAERAMQNGGSGEEIDMRSNTGYYRSNTQRQSGMGVTMLD